MLHPCRSGIPARIWFGGGRGAGRRASHQAVMTDVGEMRREVRSASSSWAATGHAGRATGGGATDVSGEHSACPEMHRCSGAAGDAVGVAL